MEFKVEDYITDERMKEIAEEEFRASAREHLHNEQDFKRVLTNVSYENVFNLIDDELEQDSSKLVKEKTMEVLNDISSFSVFRKASFGEPDSLAQKYLEQAVKENQELIKEQVRKRIEKMGDEDVRGITEYLQETIIDSFMNTFKDKE